MMKRLVLASSSRQRKIAMESLGLPFEIIPAGLDEKAIKDSGPLIRVEKLARAKAEAVGKNTKGVIVAADTFILLSGLTLEKPESKEEAREMLRMQSGQVFEALTGFCYIDSEARIDHSHADTSLVRMRELEEEEIQNIIDVYPVTTWSAGFCPAYTYMNAMIERVEGSPTGFLYGIPLDKIIPLLFRSGFHPMPKPLS